MRLIDRILQDWRARKALPWIPKGARVLDIGCHRGEFLLSIGGRIGQSIGIDPLAPKLQRDNVRLFRESFREPLPLDSAAFDVVVMLATLEHIRDKEAVARECHRLLAPAGRVVITVPAPVVDRIVDSLVLLKLANGMSLDEHHGYDPAETPTVFARCAFGLEHRSRFQLGCNHLFVFRKAAQVYS